MKEELRQILEAEWKNCSRELKYEEWREHMSRYYRDEINEQIPNLGQIIVVDGGLITQLQSKKVFDRRAIESFQKQPGRYAQVSAILHSLLTKPFENFVQFCECLVETNQTHVVVDLLTPDGVGRRVVRPAADVRHPTTESRGAEQLGVSLRGGLAAEIGVEVRRTEEARPEKPKTVDFDWRNVIRVNSPQLADKIEPDGEFMNELAKRGVINDMFIDVCKTIKGRSNRVDAILSHLTRSRPDEDFLQFCDVLHATNQSHIVDVYLGPSSVNQPPPTTTTSVPPAPDPRTRPDDLPPSTAEALRRLVDNEDGSAWRQVLIERRKGIVESMDASGELLDQLFSMGVMNRTTFEKLQEERDEPERAECLVDYMYRRSSRDFENFCRALCNTQQLHVVQKRILDEPD